MVYQGTMDFLSMVILSRSAVCENVHQSLCIDFYILYTGEYFGELENKNEGRSCCRLLQKELVTWL
jgi:hypothetical protein